jgi:hypothetical protein
MVSDLVTAGELLENSIVIVSALVANTAGSYNVLT